MFKIVCSNDIKRDDVQYIEAKDPDPSKSEFYQKVLEELDALDIAGAIHNKPGSPSR
jgi:hypothetical protein